MSNINLKFFSSKRQLDGNRQANSYNSSIEEWIEENPNLEIIDYELKVINDKENATMLIVKYRDSTKRGLMVEKE